MTHLNNSAWRSAHAYLNAFAQRRRRSADPMRAYLDRDAHDHFCAWIESHAPSHFCAECEAFVRLAQQMDQSAAARYLEGRDLLTLLAEYPDWFEPDEATAPEWDARLRYALRLRTWLVDRESLTGDETLAARADAVTSAVGRSRKLLRLMTSVGRVQPSAAKAS